MILTIVFLYILAVALYTVIIRFNGTNRYTPYFSWKSTIWEGMKGVGVGFLILAALYFGWAAIDSLRF